MTTIAHHSDYLCAAASRLGSESAFEVLARAKAIEATGRRVVHMEIGEPDFDTPDHIKRAGIRAIEENYSHYTPSAGIPELRDTIAAYASAFRGLAEPYTRENVVVGAGAKPIIWNLLSALLDPGDELLYADPAVSRVRVRGELSRSEGDPGAPARVAQLAARSRRARREDHAQDQSRRHQLTAQSHRAAC